ncbi:hypothetical protein GF339_14840 [candidate division KSB3 bacterium]|uniref:Outer membrane protein beta-barrel domain-containing protein n=1 Tax=candidate division KSB3 bacterium TaxID=2044937 RepID=A0A9D5Q6K2_9BACT|nr:hypothetical protein [candidate division KSB3 bacterium]MBD3325860.1 hypothetical protein [candidate division KSB3 bacterium]
MSIRSIKGCKTMSVIMLMGFCLACVCGVPGFAQEPGDGGRNWELMLGGGSFYQPEYSGSDEMKFEPIALVMGSYDTGRFKLFVDGDNIGTGLKFSTRIPWSLSAGVGLGAGRDNADMDILEGTPTLDNSVRLLGELAFDLPIATVSTTLNYFPISADYDEAERADNDYRGMLVDVEVSKHWTLNPFLVMVGGGVSWMNSDYAQAHYGVAYPTAHLEAFTAGSGMHSLNLSANIIMFFHNHIGTMLLAEGKQLLGDAADSSLTKRAFQGGIGLIGFYRF